MRVPIDESHPQAPVNPYGESKLMVEKMLRWYGECHGLQWMALRYFNAAGADPDGEIGEVHDPESHLIPLVIGGALGTRPPVKVFGTDYPTPDGTAVRDYIHVVDLADAHLRAIERLQAGTPSQAINLGTGVGQSVRQVIDAVREVSGRPVPFDTAPRRARRPAGTGGRSLSRPRGARLDASLRRSEDDRSARLELARGGECRRQMSLRPRCGSSHNP